MYMLRDSADRLKSEQQKFEIEKEMWRISHQDPLPDTRATLDLAMLHGVTNTDFLSERAQETLMQVAVPHLEELPAQLLRATAERTQAEHVAAAERHKLETLIRDLRDQVEELRDDNRDLRQERSELDLELRKSRDDRALKFFRIQRANREIDELHVQLGEPPPPRAQDAVAFAGEHDALAEWRQGLQRAPPDFGLRADAAGAADAAGDADDGSPADLQGTLGLGDGAARSPPPKRSKGDV